MNKSVRFLTGALCCIMLIFPLYGMDQSDKGEGRHSSTSQSKGDSKLKLAIILFAAGTEAIKENELDKAKRLLESGQADPNAYSREGPFLIVAVDREVSPMVSLLLTYGAKVDATDSRGDTALIKASGHDDPTMARMLLNKKADVNARNNLGETALMKAAQNGHFKMVRLLLNRGANPDLVDKGGKTALMKAQGSGKLDKRQRRRSFRPDKNVKARLEVISLLIRATRTVNKAELVALAKAGNTQRLRVILCR